MRFRLICIVASCFLVIRGASAQTIALRGTVVTPSGAMEHGTVLIEGARIKAVGQDVAIPSGTQVVDTGGIIYPG